MARKIINIGAIGNDGTGDSIRDSFRSVNDNFRELYSSLGLGDRLTFIGLDDTPTSYPSDYENAVVVVNATTDGVVFKKLEAGTGIQIDFENAIDGNHFQTENNYTALIYYRGNNERYDRVIGIANTNSEDIKN